MTNKTISDLTDVGTLSGNEIVEVSRPSTTIKITATTLSAQASDNSYNDSAAGFVAAGFSVGDRVHVTGFTGNVVNNIYVGVVTALTAGKMTIGGTDGDVIVDDAAGESVTIAKWVSRRANSSLLGGGATVLTPPLAAAFPTSLNIGAESTISDTALGYSHFVDSTGTSGTTLRCKLKAYPTPPFNIIFNLRVLSDYSGSDGVGLMIRDSVGGRMIKFGIELNGAGGPIIQHWLTATSFTGTVYGGSGIGSELYFLKFEDDGTNHKFYIGASPTGPWFLVRNVSRTVYLPTMDQIGFGIEDQNGSFYQMIVKHFVQA